MARTGPTPAKAAFFAHLRDHWAPALRARGFKGSGQRFHRDAGEVVHAIGVQVNKYGGSCCVNLGAHPRALPLPSGAPPGEGQPVRAESCEFRWRLTPPGYTDFWWGYERGVAAHLPLGMPGGEGATAADRAEHLARTYWEEGEPAFESLRTTADVLALIRVEDIERGYPVSPRYLYTPARAALAVAHLHAHAGDPAAARRFAEAGLRHLGHARNLLAPLEALAAGSPPARPPNPAPPRA